MRVVGFLAVLPLCWSENRYQRMHDPNNPSPPFPPPPSPFPHPPPPPTPFDQLAHAKIQCSEKGCWPNMYIIGAQKSGTTSLFGAMAQSGACGSGPHATIKEGHFFDLDWRPDTKHDEYISRYNSGGPHCKNAAKNMFLDATPGYIRHWQAPKRMYEFVPEMQRNNIKMVLLLREPVARDLSYYNHMLGNHLAGHNMSNPSRDKSAAFTAGTGQNVCDSSYLYHAKTGGTAPTYSEHVECEMKIWRHCSGDDATAWTDFPAAMHKYGQCQDQDEFGQRVSRHHVMHHAPGETGLTYLSSGMYAAQLHRWTTYWPRKQIMVMQMEALLADTKTMLAATYKFMGMPGPVPEAMPQENTKDYAFTVHTVDCASKNKMNNVFAKWNKHLFDQVHQEHLAGKAPEEEPPLIPDHWSNPDFMVQCREGTMSRPKPGVAPYFEVSEGKKGISVSASGGGGGKPTAEEERSDEFLLSAGHHSHHGHHGSHRHSRGGGTGVASGSLAEGPEVSPDPAAGPQSEDAAEPIARINTESALRPHILLWVTDDQGWGNVGYHNPIVQTPHMDKLSSEGIRLDRHYTGSWCVPSRASMLTGRLPHNMVDNKGHTIPEGVKMIPVMLAKAGYVSHQVGKWHLGNQKSWQLPYMRGFNSSFGYLGSVNDYYTQHQTADSWPCDGIDLWRTDRPAKDEDGVFSLPLYGNEVKRIIKTHDVSQPLFMYVALQAMHSPSPKSRYGDGFADHGLDDFMAPYSKYGDGFAIGNGLIGAADDVLGQAVAALKEKSMWKNTLLVHTSDNGASITPIGQEVRGTNFPLRGGKNTNFEGGVRVPAFITGGALPASKRGVVKQGYVHVTDWYHTFAHVAGITLSNEQQQKIDSIDMWPWLSGQVSDSPRTMMVLGLKTNRKGATDALVNGKYKLIRGALLCDGWSGNDYPQYPRDYNSSVGLDCDPHLGELDGKASTSWLFNIVDDPSEKENLIGNPEHAAAQARMEAELDKAIAKSQPGLNKDPDVYRDDNEALCSLYARRHRGYLGPFLD